jgi:F-type H+-transporting ATPase subunit a
MQTCLFLAALDPLEHVVQHPWVQSTIRVGGHVFTFTWMSNQIVMEIAAAVLLMLVLVPMCSRLRRRVDDPEALVPTGALNFFEALCEAFRRNLARPQLGEHADRLMPLIWTVFFFILTCNVLGLLPVAAFTKPVLQDYAAGGTPTGNLWVNGTLAFFALLAILVNGFQVQGLAYFKHFLPGPWWLAPLLVPVEVMGLIAKIFALAVRLFANMLAGHLLLAILLGLIGMAYAGTGAVGGFAIGLAVLVGSVAINLLELFVAFLQAFIFTFLLTVFIGQAVHHESEHEYTHGEGPQDKKVELAVEGVTSPSA